MIAVAAVLASAHITSTLYNRMSWAPPFVVEGDILNELERKFGPSRHSQGPEEWIVRDFFHDQRNGVFVDVGAYHAIEWSNTYALEEHLAWSGVAIDALEELRNEYAAQRPRTQFLSAFVGDIDSGTSRLFVDPAEAAVSSSDKSFTAIFTKRALPRDVPNRTLDSILAKARIESIDYLSMDIELGEPAALRGFSVQRYRPRLACIEAHAKTRQQIIDYFVRAGYTIVGRYLRVDPANLYFEPLNVPPS